MSLTNQQPVRRWPLSGRPSYHHGEAAATIEVLPSQFPDQVRQELLDSLRSRKINNKFHYESYKQTRKWLQLHQAYSPSRTDDACATAYNLAFQDPSFRVAPGSVHLVSLGCGGGQKDARFLHHLGRDDRELYYTPVDVSVPMVLVARKAALAQLPPGRCHPLICDLARAETEGLLKVLAQHAPLGSPRILTFFGMIPNFEPGDILAKLAGLLRPTDHLLFSANLAPGPDYSAGMQRILPLYDNPLTRDWLTTFLFDLGFEPSDGCLDFGVEEDPATGLRKVTASFRFVRARELCVEDEPFRFEPGVKIRLFFSYRYTPDRIRGLLASYGLEVTRQWIIPSGEEGIFLVSPANSPTAARERQCPKP